MRSINSRFLFGFVLLGLGLFFVPDASAQQQINWQTQIRNFPAACPGGQAIQTLGATSNTCIAVGGGGGTPCTVTANSLQYNNAGSFGCATQFTYSGSTVTVGNTGILTWSGTGNINARSINGIEFTNMGSLGGIPINQGDGTAVWADPLVQGLQAHDDPWSTLNPVGIGGFASATAPTNVGANDLVRTWHLPNGSPVVNLASGGTLITVGQTTMSASIPVTLASDQTSVPVTAVGSLTNNGAAPSTNNVGALTALANAMAPSWTEGRLVLLSTDLDGALRVNVTAGGGVGGTSSDFGSALPTPGTAVGFSDGTDMQAGKVFDLDSGGGTDYNQGVSIRIVASGGSIPLTAGAGATAAGTLRIVSSSDSPDVTSLAAIDTDTSTIATNTGNTASSVSAIDGKLVADSSADFDTGAGTVTVRYAGIALPGNGGPVIGGTNTDPIRIDPTGTTSQPVGIQVRDASNNLVCVGYYATTPCLNLPVQSSSEKATGSAVPSVAMFVMGTDGTNGRALKTDTGGELQIDVLSSALPTNAATAGNQSTIITHVDGIETLIGTTNTNTGNSATSLAVLDDWDESDRAKVNPIVGQAGVAAGAGAVGATVQRMTLASDDPAVGHLATLAGAVMGGEMQVSGSFSASFEVTDDMGMLQCVGYDMACLNVPTQNVTDGATGAAVPTWATLIGWENGSGNLVTASAATPFPVEIIAGAGSGGTAAADDADFTAGTTSATPVMGVYESSPTNVTDGDLGTVGITQTRALRTVVEALPNEGQQTMANSISVAIASNQSAVAVDSELAAAATLNAGFATPTTAPVGAFVMGYNGATWDPVALTSADELRVATIGANSTIGLSNSSSTRLASTNGLNAAASDSMLPAQLIAQCDDTSPTALTENQFGNLRMNCTDHSMRVSTADPCSLGGKLYLPIDIVTATTTEITPSLAGASTHYYICSINLVTAGANNVALVDDDTDGCGSPTAGVMGGVTAAEGWNFSANGGLTLGNGAGAVGRTVTANSVLCIITSAAVQLSGQIVVIAAP